MRIRITAKNKKQEPTRHEILEHLTAKMEDKFLSENDLKASVADYIKLLQVLREIEGDRPGRIQVCWSGTLPSDGQTS